MHEMPIRGAPFVGAVRRFATIPLTTISEFVTKSTVATRFFNFHDRAVSRLINQRRRIRWSRAQQRKHHQRRSYKPYHGISSSVFDHGPTTPAVARLFDEQSDYSINAPTSPRTRRSCSRKHQVIIARARHDVVRNNAGLAHLIPGNVAAGGVTVCWADRYRERQADSPLANSGRGCVEASCRNGNEQPCCSAPATQLPPAVGLWPPTNGNSPAQGDGSLGRPASLQLHPAVGNFIPLSDLASLPRFWPSTYYVEPWINRFAYARAVRAAGSSPVEHHPLGRCYQPIVCVVPLSRFCH